MVAKKKIDKVFTLLAFILLIGLTTAMSTAEYGLLWITLAIVVIGLLFIKDWTVDKDSNSV